MKRQDYKHYFDTLELPLEADLSEVRKAYLLLKEIYSKDSIVTMSVADEISLEQKDEIIRQIEEAYQALTALFNKEQNSVVEYIDQIVADISVYDGPTLKMIRQKLKLSLDDVAMATRIQQKQLLNIEEDNYESLPVPVYTRGFVVNYAKFLSLDTELVARSYMEKFHKWQDEQGNKTS